MYVRTAFWKTLGITSLVMASFPFIVPLMVGVDSVAELLDRARGLLWGFVLAVLLLGLFLLAHGWLHAKKQFSTSHALRGIARYEFADDAVTIYEAEGDRRLRYGNFYRAFETPRVFVAQLSSAELLILPKRVFNPDALETFRHRIWPLVCGDRRPPR